MYQTLNKGCSRLFMVLVLLVIGGCSSNSTAHKQGQLTLDSPRYAHASATDGKLIYVFAGSNGNKFLQDIEIINPLTGFVEILKDRLLPRRYFSAVWDGQHSIYLIGGVTLNDGRATLQHRVEKFDLLTKQVTFAKPLPQPTRNSRSVFLDGRIYVFGGSTYERTPPYKLLSTSTTAMYDIASNRWIKLADMPTAKTSAVIVKDGSIYLAGGFNHQDALGTFERYEPKTNQWHTLAPLPRNISAHSATLLGDSLLLFGDYQELGLTLRYDFPRQSWTEVELGYQDSRHNSALTIGDKAYVVGGNINSKGKSLNLVQQFSLTQLH